MNINIGGGNWFLPGWKNVDFTEQGTQKEFIDFEIKIKEDTTLPFTDNSVDLIYTSACLCQLISLKSVENILNECYRILKQKGMLRINTCNEWLFRVGGFRCHIIWLDFTVMLSLLYSCSFKKVYYMKPRRSHKPIFCLPFVFRNDYDGIFYQLDVMKI